MNIRYHIDPATGEPHIYNHGVDETEIEDILGGKHQSIRGSRDTRIALGQTTAGRHLKVIYVPGSASQEMFVITAYQLEGKQLRAHRRWLRRKHGRK